MIARQTKLWWLFVTLVFTLPIAAQSDWTDKSPHKAGFITVNNVKLHYLDWGGAGETLLFLHGMGGTAHFYDDFAPRFTNQFRVLGLTRRGHGESEMPETGYDTATLVEDIRQFLDALKVQRAVLAGHSFAGDELTRFAVVHPDRVIKLIYFDSAYDHSRVPENLRFKPLHGVVPELLPTKEESESPDGGRRWVMRIWGEKMGRTIYSMIEGTYSETHEYGKIKAPALAFFAIGYCPASPANSKCRGFDRKKVVDWAESLPEPQRKNAREFIKAQREYYEQEIEHFRREIPNGRVIVFTNADHVCFIDREPEVLREMREFLSDTGSRRPKISFPPPVELEIPLAPTPVKANGKQWLVYELHITSFFTNKLELTRVEVLRDGGKKPFASYQDEELTTRIAHAGLWVTGPTLPDDQPDKRIIGPGRRAVMYLLISFDSVADIPRVLRHRLYFKPTAISASDHEDVVEGAQIAVDRKPPLVLGAPLRGEGWVAVRGPSNDSGHRRSSVVIGGKARIPQRFAIDWSRIDADGRTYHGDRATNSNWLSNNANSLSYGAEVLAVANAVVADVKDGIPENEWGPDKRAVPITLETVAGNYVILDLGKNNFALYAHLQPKSIRVRVGQRARRGQVLALLGNSGHSEGPHLHFHVMNGNSVLGAEGVPYVFESFEVLGQLGNWKPPPTAKADKRRREIPVENFVVRFP